MLQYLNPIWEESIDTSNYIGYPLIDVTFQSPINDPMDTEVGEEVYELVEEIGVDTEGEYEDTLAIATLEVGA